MLPCSHFIQSLQDLEPNISAVDIDARIEAEFASWFRNFVSNFVFKSSISSNLFCEYKD